MTGQQDEIKQDRRPATDSEPPAKKGKQSDEIQIMVSTSGVYVSEKLPLSSSSDRKESSNSAEVTPTSEKVIIKPPMNPIVKTACDRAVSAAFGESTATSYRPIGPTANTAFSGSVVLELEVTTRVPGVTVADRVVLKHSAVRKRSLEEHSEGYAAAAKNDKSSRNECAFLRAYWKFLVDSKHTRIPGVLFARDHPKEGVTLLLESLSNNNHRVAEIPLGPKTDAALEWLAHFHARFLPVNPNALKSDPLDGTDSFSWDVGTHLSLEKRPPSELESLPATLSSFLDRFRDSHEYFSTSKAQQQGDRIKAVAKDVATCLHPGHCNPNHKTMVHGDYKQGNMFFAANDDDVPKDSIAVFDWQWTGPGIGATDLVYLCVMAVSQEALEDHETHILKPYHRSLLEAIGGDSKTPAKDEVYPYDELLREFQLAAVDIQRWLSGSRYKSMSPESVAKAQLSVDFNHGIFRRSIPRLVWMFQTVDRVLDRIESGEIVVSKSN